MSMRKALLAVGLVVVVAGAGFGAWMLTGKARRGTAVAATVNGDPIYWSQVDAEITRAAAQFGLDAASEGFAKQREEITKAVMEQLVGTQLVMQEARRRNLVVAETAVEEQLAAIRQRFPSEEAFAQALERNGFTLASLRDVVKVSQTQQRLAEAVAQVTVTDEQLRKHFESNRAQYDQPAQIRVAHILFRIGEGSSETVARAKAKIARTKLAEGATFEDVAKQYSDDPGSAAQGGNLGFVGKGTLVKEFEAAAWALKPGQVSELVKTQYGLHLIKLYETREAQAADFAKVKDQIREQLVQAEREKAFETWLDGQRKAAKIERFDRQ